MDLDNDFPIRKVVCIGLLMLGLTVRLIGHGLLKQKKCILVASMYIQLFHYFCSSGGGRNGWKAVNVLDDVPILDTL